MQRRREHREEVQKQREKAIEETVKRRAVRLVFFMPGHEMVGEHIESYLSICVCVNVCVFVCSRTVSDS